MYCNKCGKEIAENVRFCIHCGEKVEQTDVVRKMINVCSRCGREAEDGVKFCVNCGGQIVKTARVVKASDTIKPASTYLNSTAINFVGLINVALIGILALVYLVTAINGYEGNKNAFVFLEDGYQSLGTFLHWGICAIPIGECICCLIKAMTSGIKGKQLIKTSVSLILMAVLLLIGSIVWDNFELEELSIVMYRIFNTYESLIFVTFALPIIVLICGILCLQKEQEEINRNLL